MLFRSMLGDEIAYRFLTKGEINETIETISFHKLLDRAKSIAVMLNTNGVKGKQVLLLYPSGLDFIEAFWGVIFAGGIPVTLQAAKAGEQSTFITRIKRIADDAKPGFDFVDRHGKQVLFVSGLMHGGRGRDFSNRFPEQGGGGTVGHTDPDVVSRAEISARENDDLVLAVSSG